ncbi:hypothetical protein [Streptomyces qinglanensis]|uniref:hypothetical protein n=1 Tax=Streptomyces qinglanensis TaxID=943816 RepID=UPI003796A050
MRELAPEHQPDPAHPSAAAAPHGTSLTERGSFCSASCACGWRGPARRARDRAREDSHAHLRDHGAADAAAPPPDGAAGAL